MQILKKKMELSRVQFTSASQGMTWLAIVNQLVDRSAKSGRLVHETNC